MNYAAVAGARAHAEFGHLLDEKNVAPPLRNGARHGASHDAAANNHDVCAIHGKQHS
jgi:hypothetical protein